MPNDVTATYADEEIDQARFTDAPKVSLANLIVAKFAAKEKAAAEKKAAEEKKAAAETHEAEATIAAFRAELEQMDVPALVAQAKQSGSIAESQVEDACDADAPKPALIQLLCAAHDCYKKAATAAAQKAAAEKKAAEEKKAAAEQKAAAQRKATNAIAKACALQFKLGQADEALMAGTRLRVPKHGEGVYKRFERSTFGANDHYVRFDSGEQKVALKKLKPRDWAVLAPAPTIVEAVTGAAGGKAKQETIEQVAATDGTAVSVLFVFFLHACEASKQAGIPVTFAFRFRKLLSCCFPPFFTRRNALHTAVVRLHTSPSADLCPKRKLLSSTANARGARAACSRMHSARQPSLLLLSGRAKRPRDNCSLTRSVFSAACAVFCAVMNGVCCSRSR